MAISLASVLKAKAEKAERADRPKVDYFSLKGNNPARIRFLQEIDPDAPNFDASKGSALFLVEHVSPHDFRRKAECSIETEGRCFACEMNAEGPRDPQVRWFAKTNMYVQVLDAKDNKVKVLSRPAPSPFFDQLYDWAADENEGSVVGPTFKISKGPNVTDSWTAIPTSRELEIPDTAELVDLTQAIGVKVEYDKQRNFYIPNEGASAERTRSEEKPKSKDDDDLSW